MNNLYILFFLLIIILILIICSIIQFSYKNIASGGGKIIKGGNRENSKAKRLIVDLEINGIKLHKNDIIFVVESSSNIVGYIENKADARYIDIGMQKVMGINNNIYIDITNMDYLECLGNTKLLVLESILNSTNTSVLRNPGDILDINNSRDTKIINNSQYAKKLHRNIPPIPPIPLNVPNVPIPQANLQNADFDKYDTIYNNVDINSNNQLTELQNRKLDLDLMGSNLIDNIENNSNEHKTNITKLLSVQDKIVDDRINNSLILAHDEIDNNNNSMHIRYKQSEDNANKLKRDLKQLELDLIKKNDREYAYASVNNSESISEYDKIKSFIADNEEDITGFQLKATKFILNGKTYKKDDIIPYSEFIGIIDKLPEGYILTNIPGNSYSHFG